MKIHAHILAYNEGRILPFVLDYYSQFCEKIFMYDNMSNDNSDEIYSKYCNVTVNKWESGETLNDHIHLSIKHQGYN